MSSFDLIIFDCDGTLVDSEYLHNIVIADLLAAIGLPQFDLDYNLRNFAGKGMDAVLAKIERETGRKLPPVFMEDYVREVGRRTAMELKLVDGVLETLARFDGNIPICVASNGERENVMVMVKAATLDQFFSDDRIFTKSQVVNPKPAPDLFLFAARTMGAAPARTLVIEDSDTGTTAGVAAGMTVVGLTAAAHDPVLQEAALRKAGAHHIMHRFADIHDLVAGKAA